MRRKLFNIQNLVFVTLKGEITDVVMMNIKEISRNIDLIVTEDLASIASLSAETMRTSSIQELVSNVISKYNSLKQHRDIFLVEM